MKREQEMQKEVENVIQKIRNLPSGTEISISKLLDSVSIYSDEELTNMCCKIFEICDKENIELDFSKYENQKVGLLYNIPFLVKKD